MTSTDQHVCGCYYLVSNGSDCYGKAPLRRYLVPIDINVHTIVHGSASSTILTQTFENPSSNNNIEELKYAFPIYAGVSVVKFECVIGDRTIKGVVNEKQEAKKQYHNAVSQGKTAALFEQIPDAADVFLTTLGNVSSGMTITVNITYVGELVHDAGTDGIRVTIPTQIAPRYGLYSGSLDEVGASPTRKMNITVDALMPDGSWIKEMSSPSHPISVSIGAISNGVSATPNLAAGSATLGLDVAELHKDFVMNIVLDDGVGQPKALLEQHASLSGQRALMATVVPKFQIGQICPEIIFIADRSGSMEGNIPTLISALQTFLKSLPAGVMFNICSFGSSYSFLWPKSKPYTQENLYQAMDHVKHFDAEMGGTEILSAMEAAISQRYEKLPLELLLLTDGAIWNQEQLFDSITRHASNGPASLRVFSLGIGDGVSHALINGVARAGRGFSQTVMNGERFEGKVVRMLKGALSPHIHDDSLEVQFDEDVKVKEDFEMVDAIHDLPVKTEGINAKSTSTSTVNGSMSFYNQELDLDKPTKSHSPEIEMLEMLQIPYTLPPLFTFNRTTVYILLSPILSQRTPTALILRATSPDGPLELKIEIQRLEKPDELIHQLAARKAMQELEEKTGWVEDAKDRNGKLIREHHPGFMHSIMQHEAVALGVRYQVTGKWTKCCA